jgi:hypothetical protein
MEPSRGEGHVDTYWQRERDRIAAAASTPREMAHALRALAQRARQRADWVQVRSGAAIDRAAAAEIQHELAWRRFGIGPPPADPPVPTRHAPPEAPLQLEPDPRSPIEIAQALQVLAAGARRRADASRQHLSQSVERAHRVARAAAGGREQVARERQERASRLGGAAGR